MICKGIEFRQFFVLRLFGDKLYIYISEPLFLLWYYISEVRVNFFHVRMFCYRWRFYTYRIPHLVSRCCWRYSISSLLINSGGKCFFFNISHCFQLLRQSWSIFCTKYCSFFLHLPHIEVQLSRWEKVTSLIMSIPYFWSIVFLAIFRK